MKKFAVILCGCGASDGSEINEAIMTLLAIDKCDCSYTVFAPNDKQFHVINHITQQPMQEERNMMVEAARIVRGAIQDITAYNPKDFDALVIPGGFGVAKNLITYAFDGRKAQIRPDVEKAVRDTYENNKPIGALCIAPVLIAKILKQVTITVGTDPKTIADVESFGATHINTQQTEVIADKQNMIFSTPCYMLPATLKDIAACAENLIETMLENM